MCVKEEEWSWVISLADRLVVEVAGKARRSPSGEEIAVRILGGEGGVGLGVGGHQRCRHEGCRGRDDSRWVVRRSNAFRYRVHTAPPSRDEWGEGGRWYLDVGGHRLALSTIRYDKNNYFNTKPRYRVYDML